MEMIGRTPNAAESATSNLIIKITSMDETLVKTAQIALTRTPSFVMKQGRVYLAPD